IPGDSPMGFRLPLNSVAEKFQPEAMDDSFGSTIKSDNVEKKEKPSKKNISAESEESEIKLPLKTTLCIEVRNGNIRIFMPPVTYLENWIELISKIEKISEILKMPVILEGYEPPVDVNLQNFRITPDPGVLE